MDVVWSVSKRAESVFLTEKSLKEEQEKAKVKKGNV